MTSTFSRRRFLQTSALASAGLFLSSSLPTMAASSLRSLTHRLPRQAGRLISLRYITHWTGGDGHASTMNWIYEEFQKRNPSVALDIFEIPSYEDAQSSALAECQESCPDILHAATTSYAEAGFLLDLTDWMTANSDRFLPVAQEGLVIDGKHYGWSAEYSPVIPVWNMQLLEDAGIGNVPRTWDELLAAGAALRSIGKYLTSFGANPMSYIDMIVFSLPGGPEAMANLDFTAQPFLDALSRINELVPYVPENDAENHWDEAMQLFVSEQTAFELNGAWTIGSELLSDVAPENFADQIAFSPFPDVGGGTTVYLDTFTFIGASAALADDPAKLAAVYHFFDFWTGPEAATRFVTEARSPMGVTTGDFSQADPLVAGFFGVKADNVFTYPAALRAGNTYGAGEAAIQALLLGMSIEEAASFYADSF